MNPNETALVPIGFEPDYRELGAAPYGILKGSAIANDSLKFSQPMTSHALLAQREPAEIRSAA